MYLVILHLLKDFCVMRYAKNVYCRTRYCLTLDHTSYVFDEVLNPLTISQSILLFTRIKQSISKLLVTSEHRNSLFKEEEIKKEQQLLT